MRLLALMIAISTLLATPAAAIDEFADIVMIDNLPVGDRAVSTAFRRSRGEACEIIPKGESLEINSFRSTLTARDVARAKKQRLIPASRRSAFSVGLEIEASDRAEMPIISRGSIVDYLEENYVDIQTRVRKDLLDRKLYFHHRPLAVTAQYRGSKLTQPFEPVVSTSIRDFHSLGLFAQPGKRFYDPEELRTIVLLFRTPMLRPGTRLQEDVFEFVFIHGTTDETGTDLTPHVFITTEGRTQLSYLRELTRKPLRPASCDILGKIVITDFDSSGIYPRKSATKSYRLASQQTLPIDDLDAFCNTKSLTGGFSQNVPAVLNAIIAEELPTAVRH